MIYVYPNGPRPAHHDAIDTATPSPEAGPGSALGSTCWTFEETAEAHTHQPTAQRQAHIRKKRRSSIESAAALIFTWRRGGVAGSFIVISFCAFPSPSPESSASSSSLRMRAGVDVVEMPASVGCATRGGADTGVGLPPREGVPRFRPHGVVLFASARWKSPKGDYAVMIGAHNTAAVLLPPELRRSDLASMSDVATYSGYVLYSALLRSAGLVAYPSSTSLSTAAYLVRIVTKSTASSIVSPMNVSVILGHDSDVLSVFTPWRSACATTTVVAGLNPDEANRDYQCTCAPDAADDIAAKLSINIQTCVIWSDIDVKMVDISQHASHGSSIIRPIAPTFSSQIKAMVSVARSLLSEYEISLDQNLSRVSHDSVDAPIHTYIEEAYLCQYQLPSMYNMGSMHARCRIRAGDQYTLKVLGRSKHYAPGMSYKRPVESTLQDEPRMVPVDEAQFLGAYVIEVAEKTLECDDWIVVARRYSPGNMYNCEFEWCNHTSSPSGASFRRMLKRIHSEYVMVFSMSRYIDTQFIDQLRANAIPTLDLGRPPASGHVFRVKVDGEHTWVIDTGSFWYYCRQNRMLDVTGYVMKGSLGVYKRKPAVMRCERLLSGAVVFIGMLSYVQNNVTDGLPIRRPYDTDYHILRSMTDLPPVIIRQFHQQYTDAYNEYMSGALPCDGVIAVDMSCSLTYRIKDITIDLVVTEVGRLTHNKPTQRFMEEFGDNQLYWPADHNAKPGEIYECATSVVDGEVIVTPVPRQFDKDVPNKAELTLIRRVSSFSFTVRAALYNYAVSSAT
ncbi:hypothetical protein BDK51DRAFT_37716, partial [Blyttiomyces helicus]